jgi:hypothetical protein
MLTVYKTFWMPRYNLCETTAKQASETKDKYIKCKKKLTTRPEMKNPKDYAEALR